MHPTEEATRSQGPVELEIPEAFNEDWLAALPKDFPKCIVLSGRIARADGEPITIEQYLELPEDFPALLNEYGELEMSPASDKVHNNRRNAFYRILSFYCQQCGNPNGVGIEEEIFVSGFRSYRPDLSYFSRERLQTAIQPIGKRGQRYAVEAPDLVVEILSYSNLEKVVVGEEKKLWKQKSTSKWAPIFKELIQDKSLTKIDLHLKLYEATQVKEVWIVGEVTNVYSPKLTVYRLASGKLHKSAEFMAGELFCSPLFPNLAIDPQWIQDGVPEGFYLIRFFPQLYAIKDEHNPQLTSQAYQLIQRIQQALTLPSHPTA
ncbi:hypothetical protein A7Q09_09850 [Methylacidiphilum sp. Yel]|jgi:Uma2 family endonuclease|uniref:Uma2 family endonuclease n=1 Tax=Methylacidiphilum sp. Yel TaxID=1847730 RepID=UPI00106D5867|nr:Uma2 family endonuclease [Methylacidiphilum sp. Yel]TFE66513.1 hypothetical protein A7Q09_09850 [Methylacidiphilum sp. Yel]